MKLHHIGLAVERILDAAAFYGQAFDYRVCLGPLHDAPQQARIALLGSDTGGVLVELVEPLDRRSPVHRMVERNIGAYHVCYEVDDLDTALARLRACGCVCLGPAVPAVAFGGRRIAWLYTPHRQLVELLEAEHDPTDQ